MIQTAYAHLHDRKIRFDVGRWVKVEMGWPDKRYNVGLFAKFFRHFSIKDAH